MSPEREIVRPVVTPRTPRLGSPAVMVSSESDMRLLDEQLGLETDRYRRLFMSRHRADATGFSITGPMVGAPYAVMLLETLIARGAASFIFWGWCGAISPDVNIGDIVVPERALIDEGTSRHYGLDFGAMSASGIVIRDAVTAIMGRRKIPHHSGTIWSTDAIYRETPDKVAGFRNRGAVAVEMEVSALFSAGRFRGVDVCALLVVSDELSPSGGWTPGFGDDRFKQSRRAVCNLIVDLCRQCQMPT